MSVPEVRPSISSPSIPRPRTAENAPPVEGEPPAVQEVEAAQAEMEAEQAPAPAPAPVARYPWPEPWRSFRGARPRTEYWDVVTASWRSRGPLPRPRPGD